MVEPTIPAPGAPARRRVESAQARPPYWQPTPKEQRMSKVIALITTSVDGYIAARHDEPGRGLGEGGEAIHAWVFGGTWRYQDANRGEMDPQDAAWFAAVNERIGGVVCGRYTYEAAGHWGDRN